MTNYTTYTFCNVHSDMMITSKCLYTGLSQFRSLPHPNPMFPLGPASSSTSRRRLRGSYYSPHRTSSGPNGPHRASSDLNGP